MPSEIQHGVNISIVKAINTGLKIREITEDIEIRKALIYVYALIGLRPEHYPTPSEDALLFKVIRDKYAGYTLDEIKTAFMMAVCRELSEDLNIDHFQMFTAEYLGRVMAAYKVHRLEVAKKMNSSQTKYQEPKIDTLEYLNKFLIEPYDKMMQGGPYPFSEMDGYLLYNRLSKLIGYDEEQRQGFKDSARASLVKDRTESDENFERRIIQKAKHLAFKSWIEEKIFDEFDLREFINSKLKP